MAFSFGYVPDYRKKSLLKDIYLKIFGYPYPPRRNEARKLFKLLKPKKSDKILDIGSGDGIWYLGLLRKGFDITGIDISKHDISKLKARAEKLNLIPKIVKMDAQNMRFKDESFDKIYSISTIEHIPDDNAVYKGAYRILRKGGKFVISIPLHKASLYSKIIVVLPKFIKNALFVEGIANSKNEEGVIAFHSKKYSHFHNYREDEIIKRLKKIGFKIEKIGYNCKFFGSLIFSMYHSLKIFEREKGMETGYKFKNATLFALVAPVFYLFFLIDDLLFWEKGLIIIISMGK